MDKKKKFRVLSLFDGMACTRIALDKLGFKDVEYFASEIDPYAIKVAKDNYPDIIHIGDVTKIDAKKLKELGHIDLLIGGSPCFPEGTMVFTKNGFKDIKELKKGEEVLTHKGRFKKILRWGGKISDKLVKIKAFGVDEINSTTNHPYYVRLKMNDGSFSHPFWESAGNLTKRHYLSSTPVLESRSSESIEADKYGIKLNNDMLNFIGRFTADGWIVKTKRKYRKNSFLYKTVLCCSKAEFNEVDSILKKLPFAYSFTEERTTFKFVLSGQNLCNYMSLMNRGAKNKIVHPDVWKIDESLQNSYLEGYFDGDGYLKNEKVIKYTSISRNLLFGVKLLLLKNKKAKPMLHKTIKSKTYVIENRIVNQNDLYDLSYKIENSDKDRAFIDDSGILWGPIAKIETIDVEPTAVYNIEVEDDNSYTANSIIVHNCQGFSRSGKGLNFDDPRSKLFFNYVEILKKLKPDYFILENVHMKEEWQDVISSFLKVKPILLNSNLISAQNRPRLYWTNIPNIIPPKDKGLYFQDIMEHNAPDNYYYSEAGKAWMKRHAERKKKKVRELNAPNVKMQCLEASMFKNYSSQRFFQVTDVKGPRYITVKECERCQQVPDDYTKAVSNTQRYKMLGNSFSVDMIAHLINHIFTKKK